MRASNLSLVIATGYCLLWAQVTVAQVTVAQETLAHGPSAQGPSNIGISPPSVTPSGVYIVFWAASSDVVVDDVRLVGVGVVDDGLGLQTSTFTTAAQPTNTDYSSSATVTAPSTFEIFKTYEFDIIWASKPAPTQLFTTAWQPIPTAGGNSAPSLGSFGTPTAPGLSPTVASATTSTATESRASSTASSDSSGLTTGAKVGVAIGAAGFVLIVLIAALLIWRRSRQRQLRTLPNGMPYSHDLGSTNRDLTTEKEMISTPVDTLHNGYSSMPPVAQAQSRSQTESWAHADEHTAAAAAAAAAPYTDAHRGSHGSGYEDSSLPDQDSQPHMPPPVAAGAAIQRKPVGGPTHHLREPGMSDEEVARLEEEERRLDEAIAEAERRRQLQG